MTPEQIAADRIARAVEKETGLPMEPAARIGKAGVEYIAAAGLLIVTAERMAALIDERDALRAELGAARAKALEEAVKAAQAEHDEWQVEAPNLIAERHAMRCVIKRIRALAEQQR